MSSDAESAGPRRRWRGAGLVGAGCLGWAAVTIAPIVVPRLLGFAWTLGGLALAACFTAVAQVCRIHRRGQTIPQALAASRAETRRQAEARKRSRHAAAALPWLQGRRLSPETVPGVLVNPAPDGPGYHVAGYDVVLDATGEREMSVLTQVMRLTRLSSLEARSLIESAPVTVLRVPDPSMADASRYLLESSGAAVSIAGPDGER